MNTAGVLLQNLRFALLPRQIRILGQQIFRVNKGQFRGQRRILVALEFWVG
jgi:hypothetical protein